MRPPRATRHTRRSATGARDRRRYALQIPIHVHDAESPSILFHELLACLAKDALCVREDGAGRVSLPWDAVMPRQTSRASCDIHLKLKRASVSATQGGVYERRPSAGVMPRRPRRHSLTERGKSKGGRSGGGGDGGVAREATVGQLCGAIMIQKHVRARAIRREAAARAGARRSFRAVSQRTPASPRVSRGSPRLALL